MDTVVATNLNQGQQEAADGFFQFLLSDAKELIISGPGGTGKTYLMGHLIDRVMPMYHQACKMMGQTPLYNSVTMTATTNKAAEVLAQATKRPVETIHSFLNLRVQDDWNTGASYLTKTRNWMVHENLIIFIDECSMIDSGLYKVIQEGTHNCKIIYVGDHCQIAPVGEIISPIYRQGLTQYTLLEPMRNAGQPALMNLCNQLRYTVETGEFLPIKIMPGVIDWLDDTQMEQEIVEHFTAQTDLNRILSFTNQRVHDYNDFIRDLRQLPNNVTVGEKLINNKAINLGGITVSVEEPIEILSVADEIHMEKIAPGVELAVRYCDLGTRFRGTLSQVPVAEDRVHLIELMKYYGKQKNWPIYFKLKNEYPDLRPGDASTFHKAQGSTYDTVFIDATNLSRCNIADMVARMLYVAVSRPRKRIVFYGQLANKYGGLVTA